MQSKDTKLFCIQVTIKDKKQQETEEGSGKEKGDTRQANDLLSSTG